MSREVGIYGESGAAGLGLCLVLAKKKMFSMVYGVFNW